MEDFDQQLKLEALERAQKEGRDPNIRVDDDGTVMEWDAEKKAWFPKIDEDFIAKYQLNYGTTESESGSAPSSSTVTDTSTIPPMPPVTDPSYEKWYNENIHKFSNAQGAGEVAIDSKEYADYYNYYYGHYNQTPSNGESKQPSSENQSEKDLDVEESATKSVNNPDDEDEVEAESETIKKEEYFKYWQEIYGGKGTDTEEYKQFWQQYYDYSSSQGVPEEEGKHGDEQNKDTDGKKKDDVPVDKKKKEKEPPAWFEINEDKNLNVYVTGLPGEITDAEYEELMKKCGLLMFDPIKRQPKLKLYKNKDGKNKGDGLCCYIKPESVDLALQILDGYQYEGNILHVERAVFEMKGKFDPNKRKRKLTSKEKKKFLEKQQKLFDWRPDKLVGMRNRWEKVLILRNVFDPVEFEKDPLNINKVRQEVREECNRYGEIRKVTIYDRHQDGIAQVVFAEAEETDRAVDGLNRRYFRDRRLLAAAWDGKEKFKVEETEEEEKKRLAEWANFLDDSVNAEANTSAETKNDKSTPTEPIIAARVSEEVAEEQEFSDAPPSTASGVMETEISVADTELTEKFGQSENVTQGNPTSQTEDEDDKICDNDEIMSQGSPKSQDEDDTICEKQVVS